MTWREFRALTLREIRHWLRIPTAIISSFMMPFFYLLLFGQAFNLGKFLPSQGGATNPLVLAAFSGAPSYYSYFSVGMVGFVVLFSSLFAGANVIFDRRLGYVKKVAVAPVGRTLILGSRLVASVLRGILLGAVVFLVALAFARIPGLDGLTVTATVTPLGLLEIFLAMVFLSAGFTSVFLAIGFLLEQVDSYFAIINLINLPVLFSSDALAPQSVMPGWLRTISNGNPVTLAVDVMRENLFPSASYYAYGPLVYLGILFAVAVALTALSVALTRQALAPR